MYAFQRGSCTWLCVACTRCCYQQSRFHRGSYLRSTLSPWGLRWWLLSRCGSPRRRRCGTRLGSTLVGREFAVGDVITKVNTLVTKQISRVSREHTFHYTDVVPNFVGAPVYSTLLQILCGFLLWLETHLELPHGGLNPVAVCIASCFVVFQIGSVEFHLPRRCRVQVSGRRGKMRRVA